MMKNTIISAAVSAIIALAIVFLLGGKSTETLKGQTHLSGISIGASGLTVTDGGAVDLGSGGISTSAAITNTSGHVVSEGVDYYDVQQSFTAATTTPCSILNPAGATSSIMAYTMQITVGTSTAATIDIATSTTKYATTTNLVTAHSVASGVQTTLSWFPSGSQNAILAPTEYINVKTAGAGLSGYTYTGTCSVKVMKP